LRAMAVRWREAEGGTGAGAGNTPGAAESPYAKLERALREAYDAARSGRQGQRKRRIGLPELGGLLVKVFSGEFSARVEVFKRGYYDPLCVVEFSLRNGEPYSLDVGCEELWTLASRCARGEGCGLSWEEMEDVLKLAGWAANRLAELAGIPAKVEGASLVEARFTRDGELHVLPCLQVSMNGERRLMCRWAYLRRDPSGGWGVKGLLRLVPIGEVHAKMVGALMELDEMVSKYIRNRESEGAERIHASKHQGEFLELGEITLSRPDGTEEVLLEPRFSWLNYIGEDFAMVFCIFDVCVKIGDGELADTIRKEVEKAMGEVMQACRRHTEEHDPRYAVFAYIVVEALRRANLA